MNIRNTVNSDENSVTIVRESSKVDFCHMKDEFIIGETQAGSGDEHVQIVLSEQEAIALAEHIILTVVSA